MMKKIVITSLLTSLVLLNASPYIPHLSHELERNKRMIAEYEKAIEQLKERNIFLEEQKKKNPKLYDEKALYEERKDAYIQRVKLAGAEAKNIDFKIEKGMLSLKMQMELTRDDENGYYQSSRSFYQEYTIPKDVEESKITQKIEGDYFVITMPKK